MKKNMDTALKTFNSHGPGKASYEILLKAINKVFFLNVLSCIVISKVDRETLAIDSHFDHGFLDHLKLADYSKQRDNYLPHDFLSDAVQKGDECYAITENGNLAAYGWYSNKETLTDIQGLKFCFDPSYIYMYKGFTKKSYRGKRLHAVGMGMALNEYTAKGFNGIVSYVDSTNFDSLKSCYRLGYEKVGSIVIFKLFGNVFHVPTTACRKYKIRMEA